MVDETQQPVKENDNARSVETNTQNGAEEVIQNAVTSQEAAPEVATENEQVAAEAGIETETSEAVEAESAPPAPVESLPVESAAAPAQLPWWKRLFARKAKPVKSDDSVAAPPAMSEMGGVKESSTPTWRLSQPLEPRSRLGRGCQPLNYLRLRQGSLWMRCAF